jgi:RNA polymerase sigma factor (sigma-70 family)
MALRPDAKRFEALVLEHIDAAYTLARYLTRRDDAAEDIVQDAMVRAFRGFEGQRGENSRAWLLAIVRNCFLTWRAKTIALPIGADSEDGSEPWTRAETERETPETILMQHQENRAVRAVIEALPHQFREVLVLKDIEDLSYREIAEITSVPIGTVMSRLSRARKMFSEAWRARQGGTSQRVLP